MQDTTNNSTSTTLDHQNQNQRGKMPPLNLPPSLTFGPFAIPNQVFYISPSRLSYALVNLKPLLPGHVLICPVRVTPRLSQLSSNETSDLFLTVQRVSKTIERVYRASALNVAIQDGADAGQSVPHVHVHIIPRKGEDLKDRGGGDKIYEMMDGQEGNVGMHLFLEMQKRRKERETNEKEFESGPDAEEARKPRSADEMRKEADWLRGEMEVDERRESERN